MHVSGDLVVMNVGGERGIVDSGQFSITKFYEQSLQINLSTQFQNSSAISLVY